MRTQVVFQRRAECAGLNPGRAASPVDLQHPAELTEIQTNRTGIVSVQARLDTANDGRSAAVGDDGDVRLGTPVEHIGDVSLARRPDHQIGNMIQLAGEIAYDVAERLAVRMGYPVGRIIRTQLRQAFGSRHSRWVNRQLADWRSFYRGQVSVG